MINLFKGVKVFLDGVPSLEHRVVVSSGIDTLSENIDSKFPFEVDALVPKLPWRTLCSQNENTLYCNEKPKLIDYDKTVQVINVPDDIIELCKANKIQDLIRKEDILAFYETNIYKELKNKLFSFYENYLFSETNFKYYNMFADDPGRPTVTITYNKRRCGLHIDNRQTFSIDKLHSAPNGILVNLGKEPRYFLFVNQTCEQLQMLMSPNRYDSVDRIHQDFAKKFKDYPVVRLKLNPFEGYIAPTENIIHDGSTSGCTFPSLKAFAEGYFW
jgi:hypothetical protein